ncbi:MAG: hypothetical protein JO257_37555, partial [Deltaproteobacteria bacterium]|nr:hypothetical protein [Deltaproteobacteria bacterium]
MSRLVGLLAILVVGCASHHHGGGGDGGVYSSIRIEPALLHVSIALGTTHTEQYTVYGTDGTGEHDITASCALAVDSNFGAFNGATLTAQPHGGKTTVNGACGTTAGTAELWIDLTGAVIDPGAPANSDQLFGTATLGTDAARTPAIQYPIDQAVAPLNLPPIEAQWLAAGNDLFHLHVQSTFASVDAYTPNPQLTFSTADWAAIAGTAAGDTLTITVEGLAQASPATKFASSPVAFHMSHDTIDTSAIYWWSSSAGSIMTQTFGQTTQPSPVIANCSGCHSLSRA